MGTSGPSGPPGQSGPSGPQGPGDIGCNFQKSGTQSISASSAAAITSWTTIYDTDNMSSAANVITIKTAGKYYIWMSLDIQGGGTSDGTVQVVDAYFTCSGAGPASQRYYSYYLRNQQTSVLLFYEGDFDVNDVITPNIRNGDASNSITVNITSYMGSRLVGKEG